MSAITAGVHRGPVSATDLSGWRVAELTGGATKAEVLSKIAEALEFPDWFGHNLDALWDCLTDLTEPTVLIWHGWEDFAVQQSRDWAALLRVLTERTGQRPDFALICA